VKQAGRVAGLKLLLTTLMTPDRRAVSDAAVNSRVTRPHSGLPACRVLASQLYSSNLISGLVSQCRQLTQLLPLSATVASHVQFSVIVDGIALTDEMWWSDVGMCEKYRAEHRRRQLKCIATYSLRPGDPQTIRHPKTTNGNYTAS